MKPLQAFPARRKLSQSQCALGERCKNRDTMSHGVCSQMACVGRATRERRQTMKQKFKKQSARLTTLAYLCQVLFFISKGAKALKSHVLLGCRCCWADFTPPGVTSFLYLVLLCAARVGRLYTGWVEINPALVQSSTHTCLHCRHCRPVCSFLWHAAVASMPGAAAAAGQRGLAGGEGEGGGKERVLRHAAARCNVAMVHK